MFEVLSTMKCRESECVHVLQTQHGTSLRLSYLTSVDLSPWSSHMLELFVIYFVEMLSYGIKEKVVTDPLASKSRTDVDLCFP